MLVGTPFTWIEVSATASVPSPLNLPGDFDSTTVPVTPAPAGMTTSPSTATEWARVPVKVSPAFAVLVSMVLPMRATRLVPAGTTIGGGGGGGGGVWACEFISFACCGGGGGVWFCEFIPFACCGGLVLAGWF